jgi:hypothetical protein
MQRRLMQVPDPGSTFCMGADHDVRWRGPVPVSL